MYRVCAVCLTARRTGLSLAPGTIVLCRVTSQQGMRPADTPVQCMSPTGKAWVQLHVAEMFGVRPGACSGDKHRTEDFPSNFWV